KNLPVGAMRQTDHLGADRSKTLPFPVTVWAVGSALHDLVDPPPLQMTPDPGVQRAARISESTQHDTDAALPLEVAAQPVLNDHSRAQVGDATIEPGRVELTHHAACGLHILRRYRAGPDRTMRMSRGDQTRREVSR